MQERRHVIIVRDIPEKVYESLWNLRRKRKASSWADFFAKLVEEFEDELKEEEWL
jgi:hypothetical protein